jgi:hypothetical protein
MLACLHGKSFRVSFGGVPSGAIPDLDDETTLNCILHLVRVMRSDHGWEPRALYHDPEPDWVVDPPTSMRQTLHPSYTSALIAALCSFK